MFPFKRFLLLCAFAFGPPLLAQSALIAEPIPLTNTRYGPIAASGKLVTNGRDFFLFWQARGAIHMTRITDGEPRVGMLLVSSADYDVVWTGAGFLVAFVDEGSTPSIRTQLFDDEGRPLTKPAAVIQARYPRLAFNGTRTLLLGTVQSTNQGISVVIHANGSATGSPRTVALYAPQSLASDGKGFAAVFSKRTAGGDYEHWVRLYDSEGVPLGEQLVIEQQPFRASAAIAASPAGYLITQCGHNLRCDATLLDGAGQKRDSVILEALDRYETPNDTVATWNGEGWTVAYSRLSSKTIRFAHLDAEARTILSREETPGHMAQSLAAIGTRVKTAWLRNQGDPLSTADLSLESNVARISTHVTADQYVNATASSRDAALIVWTERQHVRVTLWAGVRRASGLWRQRELSNHSASHSPRYFHAVASSDGRAFVVAWTDGRTSHATSLDSYGWTRWSRRLPFFPDSMAWNGSIFGLINVTTAGNNRIAQLVSLTSTGRVSERVIIPVGTVSYARIASDGYGFVALLIRACIFPECVPETVAMRLGADLQRSDDVTMRLSNESGSGSILWNGREYLVTLWGGDLRIPRVGPPTPVLSLYDIHGAIPTRDGYAAFVNSSVGLFSMDGALRAAVSLPEAALYNQPDLVELPDGRVAVVYESAQKAAPHYGASRVMMAIADVLPPVKPDPPSIGVTETGGGDYIVHWTPPPQMVTGYRLEYKAGDAPWKEIEHWFPADARWTTFEPMDAGETYAFRMRAWSDGGLSAYSNEVRSSSSIARSSID